MLKYKKVIMQGAEILNACRHMLRAITIKCDRMISNPKHVVPIEDYEEEKNIVDHNVD